jgi:hypothetical protein
LTIGVLTISSGAGEGAVGLGLGDRRCGHATRRGRLVGGGVLHVGGLDGGLLDHDLHVHHVLHEVLGDARHHLPEHLEALTLPLDERVLLAHGPQVDALLQVVHLVEVLAPLLVDDLEHHLTLDLAHRRGAELLLALLVVARGLAHELVVERVGGLGLAQVVDGEQ